MRNAMVPDYIAVLKGEKGKQVNIIGILLCCIAAAFFVLQLQSGRWRVLFVISTCVIIAGLIRNGYVRFKKQQAVQYRYLLLVAGITWFAMPYLPWIGIAFIFLSFMEKQAGYTPKIMFAPDHIIVDSLLKKTFLWHDVNNVMLKDGILTLDFKNNKLIQKEITDSIDQTSFNAYCQVHLTKASLL